MAKKVKSRTIAVRLLSMAMTGYYRTLRRPRAHRPLSMMKYDPVGMFVKFLPSFSSIRHVGPERKKRGPETK
ncbi:MAG: hypothetical protein Q9173_006382 [Seirophora scorigena]